MLYRIQIGKSPDEKDYKTELKEARRIIDHVLTFYGLVNGSDYAISNGSDAYGNPIASVVFLRGKPPDDLFEVAKMRIKLIPENPTWVK